MAESASKRRRRRGRGRQKEKRVFKKPEPKWKLELREIEATIAQYDGLESENVSKFTDLPLSRQTLDGLQAAGYAVPTEIQREAIPLALKGMDVLGAAKTGSGKTLAFLVPILEVLWRERWTSIDGLGALVISPTRELAYQTFEVLRKIGCHHDFSAGLVIGGKDLKMEQERIRTTNIVICTPGRLLQHMDETATFECTSLKVLVLDEADRILDLGFQRTMNAIVENLPPDRQTLLFSATQTKSVRDLARLSLTDPEYVAVHENSVSSTPHKLVQSYIVCDLPEKLNILYSFLKSHLTSKTIVFMSSCKQVKFIYESFRRMRPGIPLMALYGRQKQMKRVGIYDDFCRKVSAVLFCTDIAARGLDFPAVHWVVQLDCPEDANTYIHRVGRTARYEKDGKALLFLLPSEEPGMLEALKAKKIPLTPIRVNPKKTTSVKRKLESLCAQDPEVKHWAQRSFICYLRSVHLQSNKRIFDMQKLPTADYAQSLGLAQPPRIRFLKKFQRARTEKERRGDVPAQAVREKERRRDSSSSEEGEGLEGGKLKTEEKGFDFRGSENESELDDEEVLRVKRVIMPRESDDDDEQSFTAHVRNTSQPKTALSTRKHVSKVSTAKKLIHKGIKLNTHMKFDDEGEPLEDEKTNVYPTEEPEMSESDSESVTPIPVDDISSVSEKRIGGISIPKAQEMLRQRDKIDRKRERERIRTHHREQRQKMRIQKQNTRATEEEGEAVLGSPVPEERTEETFEDSEGSSGEDLEAALPFPKRPRRGSVRAGRTMAEGREDEWREGGGKLELLDDEELALHLLTS